MTPIQAVLDTNLLVAALRSSSGAAARLVERLGDPTWEINLSSTLVLEYEDVFRRRGMLPHRTDEELTAFVDYLLQLANPIYVVPSRAPRLRDPNDERILEVAIGDHHSQPSGFFGGRPIRRPNLLAKRVS
jgi:predicted nucleic acid-binding protein